MSRPLFMLRTRGPLLLALLCTLLSSSAQALDVPYLTGRVVDNAEILSPAMREQITEQLKQHETATTNQIAVLTVSSLEGESRALILPYCPTASLAFAALSARLMALFMIFRQALKSCSNGPGLALWVTACFKSPSAA